MEDSKLSSNKTSIGQLIPATQGRIIPPMEEAFNFLSSQVEYLQDATDRLSIKTEPIRLKLPSVPVDKNMKEVCEASSDIRRALEELGIKVCIARAQIETIIEEMEI